MNANYHMTSAISEKTCSFLADLQVRALFVLAEKPKHVNFTLEGYQQKTASSNRTSGWQTNKLLTNGLQTFR